MKNCNHIAYVASHEDARKLLNLLTVNLHEDLSYYHIKEEGISRKTLEALCNFEMIESSKSIAYGYSKEHVVKNSLYNITPYGENFINVFKQLATISKDTISAQLAVGDFRKFKEKLVIFLESNNPEEIREAYEFIFGTDGYSTNFDEYNEDDFSHFDNLCLLCIDQYYRAAQIAYEKYGDKYKHITKDSLEKTIKNCTTFDYLYDKLTSDILTYDDNHEELKKLILA